MEYNRLILVFLKHENEELFIIIGAVDDCITLKNIKR